MDVCTIASHKNAGLTVVPIPAKLLIRSPLAPDCHFELRVERDITSEEWDTLFEYLNVCRRGADRRAAMLNSELTGTADDDIPREIILAIPRVLGESK